MNAIDRTKERIFISYRREDDSGWITQLSDELSERFTRELVFKDNETITTGNDFANLINEALSETGIFIVVIGKNWKGNRKLGRPKIWNQNDWVRKEIEFAGKHILRIFPVLVDDAAMPKKHELPPSLAFYYIFRHFNCVVIIGRLIWGLS